MSNNYTKAHINTINRRFAKILLAMFAICVAFDLCSYIALAPPLRVAKIETFKKPLADKIISDNAYLALFPIGSDKTYVLEELKAGGFDDLKNGTPLSSDHQKESYFGLANLTAGLVGTIFFIWYEVQITVEFTDNQLSDIKAYIFKSSI